MKNTGEISVNRPLFYPWLVVALLCVVGCLNYLDRMMITTMRGSILEAIPMSDTQFGLLTSVFLWVYGLLSPLAGFLADRFSRSKVIIGSLFVWSLVTWLTSRATSFEELLLTRALMGVSEACYIPAALALIMDYHRDKTRSLATGIHMGGIMVGQSLGFIGGWLAENHSWTFAFSIFGIIGIGYALLLAVTLKDIGKTDDTRAAGSRPPIGFGDAVRNLFGGKDYILAIIYWGLVSIVGWIVVGWLPTYYKEHFNLSQSMAGVYATGYFHTASLAGVLLGGFLADRWSRKNPRGRMLVPLYGLLIAAPAIYLASGTGILPVAIVCFMVYALTRTFTDANMMPILCLITDARYRATAYGILNLFSCIVGGLGIYAGGVLRDANVDLNNMFRVAAAILLACVAVMYFIRPDPKKASSEFN
ncbi:MFS transporter [Dyadobacter sp. CY327]|uniref:MFS transporter n=1 Tax=Dyadobacter sp. CY327 TaxID=2907301 RepID=UPI001F2A26FD|nr:MFS transporter [Dyadobacter sp. CY327]MCE7070861.1 MFS transporter [Dyadobacter sp. CY327]